MTANQCPVCKTECLSQAMMFEHLLEKHLIYKRRMKQTAQIHGEVEDVSAYRCWCGAGWTRTGMLMHLVEAIRLDGDLETHYILSRMGAKHEETR